jgi:chromatin segregation and condensation protein Rec8/ScpA/Scc1 (kleisin family)
MTDYLKAKICGPSHAVRDEIPLDREMYDKKKIYEREAEERAKQREENSRKQKEEEAEKKRVNPKHFNHHKKNNSIEGFFENMADQLTELVENLMGGNMDGIMNFFDHIFDNVNFLDKWVKDLLEGNY